MLGEMIIGISLLFFVSILRTTEAQNSYYYNTQDHGFDYSKTYPVLDDTGRQSDLSYDALRYEVTENVIDIPNNEVRPPVIANFSLPTAIDKLNNATGSNIRNSSTNNKTRKKYFNLNINAEIGSDKPDKINNNYITNNNNNVLAPHINNFNNKLKTVLANLVNNVNKVVNKNSVVIPNVLAGPVKLFNKVHKQKDEVFSKIHDVLDVDDDDDLFDDEFDPLNF